MIVFPGNSKARVGYILPDTLSLSALAEQRNSELTHKQLSTNRRAQLFVSNQNLSKVLRNARMKMSTVIASFQKGVLNEAF